MSIYIHKQAHFSVRKGFILLPRLHEKRLTVMSGDGSGTVSPFLKIIFFIAEE